MGKFISGLLKKMGQSFKSAIPILLVALCVLIIVAIWWAGPMLEYQETFPLSSVMSRVIASVIFSLICIAFWGMYQWKALNRFKASIKREEQLKADPILQFEERQEVELNQIMVNMKENLNKRNYLYALPWYLVIGLENAGKTSLINRSGQNFVFSTVMRASGKKSENPYSFDWWIGEESVLIDPDGELLTQGYNNEDNDGQMERRLWVHFIEWLERTRSRRPLNGVVIALDVAQLASGTTSSRKAYASLLRTRLRELMETLSTRMPVYVTLTKMDLLHGFEPFFRHYPKSKRDEVLGFTFSLDSVDNLDKWLDEFTEDYGRFVERIKESLPLSLLETMDNSERQSIYGFTRQISGLKEVLHEFLQDALGSDQFSTSALVRGVYFTSVFQQGVPSNAFDDAASRRYGLSHAINRAQDAKNSTVYFTQKLFNGIVYPEAGLASDNFRVAKQKRRIVALSTVVCLIATFMLIGSWHGYYIKNVNQADAVLAKVNEFRNKYPEDLSLLNQKEILEPLDTIREATLEFGFFREKPEYISDMGLYQGHMIGPKVEQTYLALLESRYLPSLMKDIALELSNAENEEHQLEVLRVFRMMIDKSGRYKEFVMDYFSKNWQRQFVGNRVTQERLLEHLDYAMNHTDLATQYREGDQAAIASVKPYEGLISKAQRDLSAMSIEQRVYRNLKSNSSTYLGAPINVRNQVGPVFDVVFEERVIDSENLMVPRMLTKQGFDSYFIEQSDSVSELALIDSWVLGQTQVAEFSAADKIALKNKIRSLYVVDYTNTWRNAMNEVDVKYFVDINNAVLVLDNLTGSTQPFTRLLQTLEDNTRLFSELPENEEAREELLKSPKYKVASMIHAPFAELNSMLHAQGAQPAYFDEVQTVVVQLLNYLKAIQDAPDVGRAALEATKARISLSNADPIYTLKRIASGLPSPLDNMVSKIADESWYVVKQEAIKHLEIRWQRDVYSVFQEKFASRYPFDQESRKDVALEDFEEFFSPDGTLDSFYSEQLKMFIEEGISISEDSAQQSLIRPEVLAQLKQAKKIQRAFFNRKGILDVAFSLEPIRLTSNKRRSVINIDGQYVEYSHGPRQSVELIWPNTLRGSSVSKVTLVPTKSNLSPRSIERKGPWALFRLLDKSEVVGGSITSVDYKFAIDRGDVSYRLYSEAAVNPFKERLFDSFKLSSTLY
ncbi:type VI secretion system membrane subunit TssM [Vibrio nigripulchritudo]|uniref:type VI secretion system membrane subunit TssM n=1 Tax=Vibrio nigripulchritudo TaxID=28173 RepID=UPI0003B197AE|nr:type VI secretion system membrane subunit TssM [Vibrio nigripulchritudo]CCN69139.1 putative Type VI secretion system, IcmF [Vibrio nigripulchritudo SFn118]